MEKLTFAQVLSKMGLDEIAINVDANFDRSSFLIEGYLPNTTGIHYDGSDNNILKSLNGNDIVLYYDLDKNEEEGYVIIKRDLYERLAQVFKEVIAEQK